MHMWGRRPKLDDDTEDDTVRVDASAESEHERVKSVNSDDGFMVSALYAAEAGAGEWPGGWKRREMTRFYFLEGRNVVLYILCLKTDF